MLIVKIELHSAIDGHVEEIARMNIINDGTGTNRLGNYDVEILRKDNGKVSSRARVEGYPRLAYSVWELVRRALGGRGSTPFTPADQSPPAPR